MRASRATEFSRWSRGFTLVELMVSVTVLALLVALLGGLFGQVSRAWVAGEGNVERHRNVRALGDYIAAELQGAVLPVEEFAKGGRGNLQFVINPPKLGADFRNADAIFWQAPLATESSHGDLAEVGYFVKWEAKRPMLCRFFVNPSVGSGSSVKPTAEFLIYDANPEKWLSDSLLNDVVQPANKSQGYKGLLAENVIGFWTRPYGLDGVELSPGVGKRTFDSRVGYLSAFETTDTKGVKQQWKEQRYLPASVRVSLAQLDSRHAQRLDPIWETVRDLAKTSTDAADFLEKLRANPALAPLLPGVRIYATEVQLHNAR